MYILENWLIGDISGHDKNNNSETKNDLRHCSRFPTLSTVAYLRYQLSR